MEQDIHFIYFQGFCEAGVSNAHLRWIAEVDGWWFTGHWDITNTSEERGMSRAKCGESRGNQGNRLQRWMAISNNIQSWINCSILGFAGGGGNLEFFNILVLNIWSGRLLFVTLGWLCFETWSETGKLLFGNILQFVAAPSLTETRSEVSGAERAWDSCDRDEILRTQQQPSSQNMAQPPCKYFIQPLENWNIGSAVRDASVSVYLCNSYQLSEDHHHGISAPGPRLASHVSSSHQLRGGMWLIVDTYQVSSLYLRGADLCLNKHPSSRKYYPSLYALYTSLHNFRLKTWKHFSLIFDFHDSSLLPLF